MKQSLRSLVIALLLNLSLTLTLVTSAASAQELAERLPMPKGYHHWTMRREDGSSLNFFTSFTRLDPERPLAVWMQGSGYNSLFPIRDGTTRYGPMSLVQEALGDDIQILGVEKRGVIFGAIGSGGSAGATREYQEHATLEERSADVVLVLSGLASKGGLPSRLLAIGHSEGADVAAKVAATYEPISHCGFLSGGGASQLFDFMVLARKSDGTAQEKEARIDELWKSWAAIEANPLSTEKMFQGHAYRRWSSYIHEAPVDNLLKTDAKILMIHGSEDTSVPIESADLCAVELSRAGRSFKYLRLPGADHSLRTESQISANSPPFLPLGLILRRFFLEE